MKNRFFTPLVLFLALLFFFSCKAGPTSTSPVKISKPKPIRIGAMAADPRHKAAFDAETKGFYSKEGIQAAIIDSYDTDQKRLAAMQTGDLDAAYVGQATVMLAAANKSLEIVIGSSATKEGWALVVRDLETKTPFELAGKGIGVPGKGTIAAVLAQKYLEKHQMDGKVYFFEMPFGEMYDTLLTHTIDGFFAISPFVSQAVTNENTGVFVTSKMIWPNHPDVCLVISKKWAKANPKEAAALVRAHKAATDSLAQLSGGNIEYAIQYNHELSMADAKEMAEYFNQNYLAKIDDVNGWLKTLFEMPVAAPVTP